MSKICTEGEGLTQISVEMDGIMKRPRPRVCVCVVVVACLTTGTTWSIY